MTAACARCGHLISNRCGECQRIHVDGDCTRLHAPHAGGLPPLRITMGLAPAAPSNDRAEIRRIRPGNWPD